MNECLNTKQAALAWLYQAELHHLMSIDMLERDLLSIVYAGHDSLLLANDDTMMIHCKAEAEWPGLLKALLERIHPDGWYILKAHENWYLPELMEKSGFTRVHEVYNGIYPESRELWGSLPPGVEIRPLTMAQFPVVRQVYTTVNDDDYIRERIEEGMIGAWYQGELAGFMGTHEDGTMGLLEVLPQFRRLGIAKALESEMIRRLRAQGRRTYGNIFKDNALSLEVHLKMGTLLSEDPVYWLFRPEE